jgi:hypothetical protein
LVQVLKQCGDNLTCENVMKQAANLRDLELGTAGRCAELEAVGATETTILPSSRAQQEQQS